MLGFYLENRKLLFDAEVLARHLEGVAFELVPLTIIRDSPGMAKDWERAE